MASIRFNPTADSAPGRRARVLPLLLAVLVGMTFDEIRMAIRKAYEARQINLAEDRIFVTLLQARQYQVLVLRQETGAFTVGPYGPVASGRRGTGNVIDLPAYQNDVLHAL